MTDNPREIAELLRDLGRPAEAISVNSGIDLLDVQNWMRTGRWPGPRQRLLFNAGAGPREIQKPVASKETSDGLQLFRASDR